jgi:hypothetical protein
MSDHAPRLSGSDAREQAFDPGPEPLYAEFLAGDEAR